MKKVAGFALASASMLAFTTPAFAQDTAPAASEDMGGAVIVVTARRRDEDVQEVPAVVNAVGAEDIQDLNLREFEEVEGLVPGLELSSNANGIGGNASVRGIRFDVNASGNNPTVEFYLNDAPTTAGPILQQMYDIGQIEVLRGPQGTLRGRASPSGAITITTRKPDLYEVGGYMQMTGNDIGGLNFQGAVGVPVIEGVAAVRVAGVWAEDDFNEVRPIAKGLDGRDPWSRTRSGRVSALLEPTDWLRMEGVYQRVERDARAYDQYECGTIADPASAPCPQQITASDRLSIYESPRLISQTFDNYTWNATASFAGQNLIYTGGYRKQRILSRQNDDGANFFQGFDYYQNVDTRSSDESHELRLQNEERLFGMLDYVVGVFKQNNNPPTDLTRETPVRLPDAFGGGLATVAVTPIQRIGGSEEKSVFGNLTLHFGDSTSISGGVRYIDIKGESQLLVNGNLLTDNPTDADKLIYTASINHFITPDVMVYASTGSSFRPGPTAIGDFSLVKSDLQQSFTSLPPENSKSYEVGVKSTLMGGRLIANLTGYYQDFNNYPYRASNGVFYQSFGFGGFDPDTGAPILVPEVGAFNFIAGVPVEVKGVEGELAFEATPNWDIGLVASYTDGKIKNGTIPCNDLNGDGVPDELASPPTLEEVQAAYGSDFLGACTVTQRASTQPPFTATLRSEYRASISDAVEAFGRGLFSYYGKSQNDPTSSIDDVSDYGLLNLYLGIRDPDGGWEVSLYGKNVLDTTKVLSRGDLATSNYQQLSLVGFDANGPILEANSAQAVSPYRTISTNAPQEFGLTVRFSFGSR